MKTFAIVLSLAAVATSPAAASDLETVCGRLMEYSPVCRQAAARAEAARAAAGTESNLPDPELEGEYLWAPPVGENKWNAGVSWSLDWPGAYPARRDAANARGDMAAREQAAEVASVRASMMSALVNAHFARLRLDMLRKISEANDSVATYVDIMAGRGIVNVLDRNKLKVERARSVAAMADAGTELETSLAELRRLAPAVPQDTLESLLVSLPENLPWSPYSQAEWERMALNAPSAKVLEAAVEVARKEMKVASAESFPSLSVGYTHALEEGKHFNGGHIGLSVPIFSNRGKRKAAELARESTRLDLEAEQERLKWEVASTCRILATLKTRISELEGAFDTTEANRLLMAAWKGGQISLVDYLTERNYFTEASLELLSLRKSYQQILAALAPLHP